MRSQMSSGGQPLQLGQTISCSEELQGLQDWAQILGNKEIQLFIGWLAGRQALASLRGVSMGVDRGMPQMHVGVYILHSVGLGSPLGLHRCEVDSQWLHMVLHRTSDLLPTNDNSTLIIRCPRCNQTWSHWLFAGARYRYVGQLEGAVRFQSELNAASDSDDS